MRHPLLRRSSPTLTLSLSLSLSLRLPRCAIHCCDAVFYAERKAMSVSFEQSARAKQVLEELCLVIEEGYAQHTLQRSPHLTLLNISPALSANVESWSLNASINSLCA